MLRPILPTFLLTVPVLLQATGWPSWRRPDRNGISTETTGSHTWPTEGPKLRWKGEVGLGFSSVVVADDRLDLPNSRNVLVGLELKPTAARPL